MIWGAAAVVLCGGLLASGGVREKLGGAWRGFSDPSLGTAPSASEPSPPPEELPPLGEQPDLAGDFELIDVDDTDRSAGLAGVLPSLSDLPIPVTKRTLRYMEQFGASEKGREAFFLRMRRASRYREHIEQSLRDANFPEDLLWLAAIESGFSPQATSQKGAVGLFQFMPETAARFGLVIQEGLDERRSITRSTEAAIAYLDFLAERYGSWDLALAAYNCGEGRLDSALEIGRAQLKRAPDERVHFHELAELRLLPRETADFVPQIHAFAIIAHNAELLALDDLDPLPAMQFAEIAVPPGARLATVARAAGMSIAELREWNPDLLADRLPGGRGDFLVYVPADRVEQTLAALPTHLARDEVTELSGEAPLGPGRMPGSVASGAPVAGAPAPGKPGGLAIAGGSGGPGGSGEGGPGKKAPTLRAAPLRPGTFLLGSGVFVQLETAATDDISIGVRLQVLDPTRNRANVGSAFSIDEKHAAPAALRPALERTSDDLRRLAFGDAGARMRDAVSTRRKTLYGRAAFGDEFLGMSQRAFTKEHPMHGAILVGITEPADDMFLEPEPTWALEATVTLRGPVQPDALAADLEAAFADAFVPTKFPALPKSTRATTGTTDKRVLIGWASSAPKTPEANAATHLAFVLACHDRIGRFHRVLRRERNLAPQAHCALESTPHGSVAWVLASPAMPFTIADAEKHVDAAVLALTVDGPTETEIAAARGALRAELARELQTAPIRGIPKSHVAAENEQILSNLPDVDRAKIIAAAKALFAKEHRMVIVGG